MTEEEVSKIANAILQSELEKSAIFSKFLMSSGKIIKNISKAPTFKDTKFRKAGREFGIKTHAQGKKMNFDARKRGPLGKRAATKLFGKSGGSLVYGASRGVPKLAKGAVKGVGFVGKAAVGTAKLGFSKNPAVSTAAWTVGGAGLAAANSSAWRTGGTIR